MDFGTESIAQVRDEIWPLLEEHYEEISLVKGIAELDPIWGAYEAAERDDGLHIFTARIDGKLVGYNVFFAQWNLHYRRLLIASNDILFITKSARRGTLAMKFVKYSEKHLFAAGMDKIQYHCKLTNSLREMLNRMGYADEEVLVGKVR